MQDREKVMLDDDIKGEANGEERKGEKTHVRRRT